MRISPPPFPSYLLALPSRRRSPPSPSPNATHTTPPPPTETNSLSGHTSVLRCARCLAHLLPTSSIISKGFTGRHGRAYLVSATPLTPSATSTSTRRFATSPSHQPSIPNTKTHAPVQRSLVTGSHTVADISCAVCGTGLGWKYVAAEEEAQRYKVGKFILETKRVVRGVCWEGVEPMDVAVAAAGEQKDSDGSGGSGSESPIEFNSEDEDECEDLFAGVWTPELARIRRKER
ncbi:yippee-domain-containing protein, partial [Trichodelitschia bisporula]